MTKTKIKNVIFDLGNVLIRWDRRRLYSKLFGENEAEMDWFLTEVCSMDWNNLHDAGRPFAEGIAEAAAKHPKYKTHIEAYFGRWPEMLGGTIDDNVRVLKDLAAAKVPLYALSNWSVETFSLVEREYDFWPHFQGIVLSGETKCVKPDPEIYRILLERYALKPQESVFIDDSLANIQTAEALGFKGIHYSEFIQLREKLTNLGISWG